MLKNLIIYALLTYSIVITYKYAQEVKEKYKYKIKLEEFYKLYEFRDTSQVKIAEGKVIEKEKYKYVYKTKRDTIKIYQVKLVELSDTLKTVFNWEWYNFLTLRDTIKFFSDSSQNYYAKIHRIWGVKKNLNLLVYLYEKKPESLWYIVYTDNPEVSQFTNVSVDGSIPQWRWYLGGGLSFNRSVYPYISNSFTYKRFKFDLNLSQKSISLGLGYRIK